MFKEILQIVPRLSSGDLGSMERTLNSRFAKVAKKFGKGLGASLLGGGLAGAALGLVDKILNPLQETQDAIDRTLKNADDLVTNAKQFGATTGELAKLRAMGQATGLQSGDMDMLISKFQGAIAEAKADPHKPTSVRQFANDKNMVESFLEFIQSLQKLDKNQQRMVQAEVFGEKQVLKMADFLQTDDWFKLARDTGGGFSASQLTEKIDKLGNLNDLKDTLEAKRGLTDLFNKGSEITADMVKAQDRRAQIDLKKENMQIKSYEDLAMISNAANDIVNMGREILLALTSGLLKLGNVETFARKASESPFMKGYIKFLKGD